MTEFETKHFLLRFLACPNCTGELTHAIDRLLCRKCDKSFAIRDGAPRFVADMEPELDYRWRRRGGPQNSADTFTARTGWRPVELDGKTVLDAGCGCGRFAAAASAMGAKVIGVDSASHAIMAAGSVAPSALIVQGDLFSLPIKPRSVDAAFSLGVLHYTASPAATFARVAESVKVGGELAVSVYASPCTDDMQRAAAAFLHDLTRAVPAGQLYSICEKHAPTLRNAFGTRWDSLARVIRPGMSPDNEECVSDFYDWHAPRFRFWHTEAEVRAWFEASGFEVIRVGDFPISMVGRRVR